MANLNQFSSRTELEMTLTDRVEAQLRLAINKNGHASMAVSGGSTPKDFFKRLSTRKLPWNKVTITLTDERWIQTDNKESNTYLVRKYLLQNEARHANYFGLKNTETLSQTALDNLNIAVKKKLLPLDVLILGMGEDGHTASLFPCSDQIRQGLQQPNDKSLIKVTPESAKHQRISFTFDALSKSHSIFLHIYGSQKKQVYEQALNSDNSIQIPVSAFLKNQNNPVQVFWAE